jgi:DNA-binding CsgD family transcriptional regulator
MFKGLIPKNVRLFKRDMPVDPRERLSLREAQIADMLAEGWSPRLIASSMGVSYEATNHYLKRIRRKLWVKGDLGEALWRMGFGKAENFWGSQERRPRT